MLKIIFLDMDGVLNSMPDEKVRKTWKYDKELYNMKLFGIDQELVNLLKLVLDRTGAKIVFSTSWRYFRDHPTVGSDWRKTLASMLNVSEEETFIGNTPDISACGGWESGSVKRRRGAEIMFWLNNNAEPGNFRYCVIDDEVCDIIGPVPERNVVHTDMKTGLQMKDVDRCVRILNE